METDQKKPGIDKTGPVVIGGVGGSGTRVVAEILSNLNFYIGNDLNGPLDNLAYTLLFKRKKWFYKYQNNKKALFKGLNVLEKTMMRSGDLSLPEYCFLANAFISMSLHGHNKEKDGSGKWPVGRVKKMFEPLANPLNNYTGWGWKEPNSHLLIGTMNEFFPGFKYIHTIRHGLDMAFSNNQQQLYNWGPMFGVDLQKGNQELPTISFKYWVSANRQALEVGKKLGTERFLWLNYDQLCHNPEPEIRKLLSFLGIPEDDFIVRKCADLPKVSASTGRFRNYDLAGFEEKDLSFLKAVGFVI